MTPAAKPASVTELHEQAEQIAATAPPLEPPRLLTVQEAIAKVMGELPNIGKGDKSPEGYQYRGIEAITKHAQPLLAKYGLVIVPKARITKVVPSPAMKDGWQDVHVEVAWTIMGPDGSALIAMTSGIGRDRSDKGANKGQTQAYKYLLLHLFCIADGKDDSDGVSYEHDRYEPPAWNAAMAKQHLVARLGSKDDAVAAWEYGSGDAITEWSQAKADELADAWLGRPMAEVDSGESGASPSSDPTDEGAVEADESSAAPTLPMDGGDDGEG